MAEISCEHVTKIYPDGTRAVEALDLLIPDGTLMVLLGPSGCGKTTLLRMIAGLEDITDGIVTIGDRIVNRVEPKDRDVAMIFQNYALYPHMSVYDNMAFSLKLKRLNKRLIDDRVRPAADTLGLQELLHKKPRHLSGGQRQRVAMGRAIVRQPQVFLMDEPLSNLDAKLRVEMRGEISRLQERLKVTTIYVTHDQVEAMTIGHLVAVMKDGVLRQVGTPEDLYERPVDLFVAGFIGSPPINLLMGRLRASDGLCVEVAGSRIRLREEVAAAPELGDYVGRQVVVGIRPENLEDASNRPTTATARIVADVELVERLGADTYVYCSVTAPPLDPKAVEELAAPDDENGSSRMVTEGARIVARLHSGAPVRIGNRLELAIGPGALHLFDPVTGSSIGRTSALAERPAAVVAP